MKDTRQNRIQSFAFVIGVCLAFCLCCFLILNCTDGTSVDESIKLKNRINPNNASAASMARLPGIGISRAEAIIAYRDSFRETNQNNQAFLNCDDLQNVKGIGPKTVQNIEEWLEF